MILESRELIFPDNVLRYALLSECLAERINIPNSQIQKINFLNATDDHNRPRVELEFITANPKKPYKVPLSEQFVLTAMILVCKDLGVRLPRSGVKVLCLREKGLAMQMTMKIQTPGM